MLADEQRYELFEDEDPFEFESIWAGIPVEKVKTKPFHDADTYDRMLAAGAFKEEEDAENCED